MVPFDRLRAQKDWLEALKDWLEALKDRLSLDPQT
jgi:hypothetical protein